MIISSSMYILKSSIDCRYQHELWIFYFWNKNHHRFWWIFRIFHKSIICDLKWVSFHFVVFFSFIFSVQFTLKHLPTFGCKLRTSRVRGNCSVHCAEPLVWPDVGIKSQANYFVKSDIFKIPKYFGEYCKKNLSTIAHKIAQSGHTHCHCQWNLTIFSSIDSFCLYRTKIVVGEI